MANTQGNGKNGRESHAVYCKDETARCDVVSRLSREIPEGDQARLVSGTYSEEGRQVYAIGLYDSAIDQTTLGWITKGQIRHELDGQAPLHEAVLRNRLLQQENERLRVDNELLEGMLDEAAQPRVITERVVVPDLRLFAPVAEAVGYQMPNGQAPQEYVEGLARFLNDMKSGQRKSLEKVVGQVDYAQRNAQVYKEKIGQLEQEVRILRALQNWRTAEQRRILPDKEAELTYAVLSNVLGLFETGEKFVAEALDIYEVNSNRKMAAGGKVFLFGELQPKLWEVISGVFYLAKDRETTGLVERTEGYFTAPECIAAGNPEWTWRLWKDDKNVDIDQLALALRRSTRAVARTLENVESEEAEVYAWKDIKGILQPERHDKRYDVRLPRPAFVQ